VQLNENPSIGDAFGKNMAYFVKARKFMPKAMPEPPKYPDLEGHSK